MKKNEIKYSILLYFVFISTNYIYSSEVFYEKFISSYVRISNNLYPYYIVVDDNGIPKEIFVESRNFVGNINGYGGPINLQIYYTLEGKIKKIKVIEHNETKEYAENVLKESYFSQYYGKTANDNFIIGKDIKAITGATISCSAINEIIYRCTNILNITLFNKETKTVYERKIDKKEFTRTIFLIFLFLLSIISYVNKYKILRILILFISIIFLGIMYDGGLSFGHVRNLLRGNLPLTTNIFFWSLIFISFIATILFGRFYCGWFCPFGAVIEFLFKIKKYFEIRYKETLGKEIEVNLVEDSNLVKNLRKYEKYYRYIKYIIAFFILLMPTLLIFEPFLYLFSIKTLNLYRFLYLIVILFFCILFIRIWCRYFCPLGAFVSLISKISLFKLHIEQKGCLSCDLCRQSCPMNAIVYEGNKLKIVNSECILCNTCRNVCGPNMIKIILINRIKRQKD
ncbi:MAG: 4Fe-4S binding protein [Endomicrobia bacterium]|nr:4Fe-4S binding protein [Endomicrobiia bacterium]